MAMQKRIHLWDLSPDQRRRARILIDAGLSEQDACVLVLMDDYGPPLILPES